jgi:cbb3-type cytochrome oxidase subunit 3
MESNQLPLRDIHLPEAIGWWPPALGWWLLAILIPLLIALVVWLYKRITQKTAIKAAKTLLLQIKQDPQRDNSQKLKDLSALIRRTAISTNVRNECAGLTGQQWLEFLDRSLKGVPFSQGIGQLLANAPYQQNAPTEQEISQLTSLCEDWLNAQTKRKR